MEDYLSPLPSDLAHLTTQASSCSQLGLSTVESIISRLELARAQLLAESEEANAGDTLLPLSSFVKTSNGKVQTAQKDWSSAVNRFTKAVDKRFTGPPLPLFPPAPAPSPPPPTDPTSPTLSTGTGTGTFSSPAAIQALNSTIALHLARWGCFQSLETFLAETETTPALDEGLLQGLKALHAILAELRVGNCRTALEWVEREGMEGGELEFELRREEYCRLLLGGEGVAPSTSAAAPAAEGVNPHVEAALRYGGTHFRRFLSPDRRDLIAALLTSAIYLPFPRLLSSPYGPLFTSYLPTTSGPVKQGAVESSALCKTFAEAFLQRLGLTRESPLSVVTDIGGGGAMGRIQKVRNVMKEKRTEWSAVGELPVEIPLPPAHRYHSIFACPVSKEQSTALNPPMLLPCGHVIARESLARLARGTPQLKCPYCPVVSRVIDAVRVYF